MPDTDGYFLVTDGEIFAVAYFFKCWGKFAKYKEYPHPLYDDGVIKLYMPIPTFDEILEANKDVLDGLKRKEIKMENPNEIINISLNNGHISLHRYEDMPDEMILSSLFVRKKRRNRNGTNLIAHAEQIAKGLGARCIFLKVKNESWQSKWYERLGYRHFGCSQDIDGLIWMRKYLDK